MISRAFLEYKNIIFMYYKNKTHSCYGNFNPSRIKFILNKHFLAQNINFINYGYLHLDFLKFI